MNLISILLISLLAISCGKNAFLEKDGNTRIISGVDGDGGGNSEDNNCSVKKVIIPSIIRSINHSHTPFYFNEIRLGEHTVHIPDEASGGIDIVDYAQVILDFDLSVINTESFKVKDININFTSDQYFKLDYGHKSQICQNQGLKCSGNEADVADHVRSENNYSWTGEKFTDFIESFPVASTHCDYHLRKIDGKFNLMGLFLSGKKSNSISLQTSDLITDYTVYIADNHKVKTASLEIEYCSK